MRENESTKLIYWLMGGMFTVLVSVMGIVYNGLHSRIEVLEDHGSPALRETIARHDVELAHFRINISEIKENQIKIMALLSQIVDRNVKMDRNRDQ